MGQATARLNKRSLFFLSGFMLSVYGTIAILMTYFPVYLQSIGYNKSAIGMVMAAGPIISIFANPFWGYLSDRTQNIRAVLLIIMLGNLALIQIIFQLHAYVWIYVAMLVFFVFQTPTFSQSTSLILNSIEGTPHQFGAFRSWGSVGWAVSAVAAAPVLALVGINKLGLVYSFMMLITLLMCFGLPRKQAGARGGGAAIGGGIKTILRNRLFLIFMSISVLISIPNVMNGMFTGLYVTDLGGSEWLVGWAVFCSAIFEVPIFLLLDRYMPKDKKRMLQFLVIVCLLFAVRWTLMAFATEAWHVVLIQMMQSITFGCYYYIGTNLTSLIVPQELRASGQAIYTIAWNGISGVVAGFLGGRLLDLWGYKSTYGAGVGLALIGCILFIILNIRMAKEIEVSN